MRNTRFNDPTDIVLQSFLKERKIEGHPKDTRVGAYFCTGCHLLLSEEKFMSSKAAINTHFKVTLCEDCREQGLTTQKVIYHNKSQTCAVCLKEKQVFDFLGNKFVGDPYMNKSKICWQCRERFELLRRAFLEVPFPRCPVCKQQKNTFAFPEDLEEPFLKKAQEFTGEIKLNKACIGCRGTKDMADFALYMKRIVIKASKKNCQEAKKRA